jgi:hypothetical protein
MNASGAVRLLGLLAAAAAASACGGSTLLVNGGPPKLDGPLRAIATTTNRPRFSNQLVAQLNALGYSALDANASAAVIGRAGGTASPGRISTVDSPDVLEGLRALKVDVLMTVEVKTTLTTFFGVTREFFDGVKVTLYSLSNPGPAGGFDWKNSWGGMPGSLADNIMRQSEPAAAQQLAPTVAKLVGPSGPRVVIDAGGPDLAASPTRRKHKKRRKGSGEEDGAALDDSGAPAAVPDGSGAPAQVAAIAETASAPSFTVDTPEPAAEHPRPLTSDEVSSIDEELIP